MSATSNGDRLHGLDDERLDALADALADRIAQRTSQPLLDAEQAGELLNVPHTWLLEQARHDRIPHIRFGRYVRFDGAELERWWRGRRRGPWRDRGVAAKAARQARMGVHPVGNGRDGQ